MPVTTVMENGITITDVLSKLLFTMHIHSLGMYNNMHNYRQQYGKHGRKRGITTLIMNAFLCTQQALTNMPDSHL